MDYGYVTINIYNPDKMLIPILGRRDATIRGLAVGQRLYNQLKRVPGLEVYTVEEDKIRLAKLQQAPVQPEPKVVESKVEVAIAAEVTVEAVQELSPQPEVEVVEELAPEVEETPEVEPVVEPEVQPQVEEEQPVITAQDVLELVAPSTELDDAIEKKLEELPEEPDMGDIVLNENDLQEIAEHSGMKKYERVTLEGMTKAQLKHILNVERAFPPGHKYYGSHHDGHVALVDHVLNSQK